MRNDEGENNNKTKKKKKGGLRGLVAAGSRNRSGMRNLPYIMLIFFFVSF